MRGTYHGLVIALLMYSACAILIIGCDVTKNSLEYYDDCINDPQCVQEINTIRNITAYSVEHSVDTVPKVSMVSHYIGSVVGSIFAFIIGVMRGKKIRGVYV